VSEQPAVPPSPLRRPQASGASSQALARSSPGAGRGRGRAETLEVPREQSTALPESLPGGRGGGERLLLHPEPFRSAHPRSHSDTASLVEQIPFGSHE